MEPQIKRQNRALPSKAAQRWKKVNLFAVKNVKDYCENTTIHGLRYMADAKLCMLERMFFTTCFICVALASTYFVYKNYEKWIYTPVIISLSSKPTWITQDPFPAVTICNMNQVYKEKAEQYSIYSVEYAMMQLICEREANATIASSITDWNHLPDFISEISQPCSEMLVNCKFGGVHYKCSEIFRPLVTDGGLCCVFNMVHMKYLIKNWTLCEKCEKPNNTEFVAWSPEYGYAPNLPQKYIPMPAAGTGESLGLSITLDVEEHQYYCTSTNSIGFKILLQNPLNVPNIRDNGIVIAPGYETKARVDAFRTETEQSLRSLDISLRHCLFQDESTLNKFWSYTQRNCEFECLADLLLRFCGCVPYYMHKIYLNKTICSIYEASCVERIIIKALVVVNGQGCPKTCIPGCYDLGYVPNFSHTPLARTGFMSVGVKNMSYAYVERNIARVHIYFTDHWYRSNIQTEYTGITDFLSSVGGIIGLFLGFSFISVAEIIYYMLLKPARILLVTKWSKVSKTLPKKDSKLSMAKKHISWKPDLEY